VFSDFSFRASDVSLEVGQLQAQFMDKLSLLSADQILLQQPEKELLDSSVGHSIHAVLLALQRRHYDQQKARLHEDAAMALLSLLPPGQAKL
jgi:hypothetical protein